MKRILYFSGYRMVVQEWQGQSLQSSIYFEPDEQGLDLFESYLQSIGNVDLSLLVDLIEEEFRQIKMPHLSGNDKKEANERQFGRLFRNSTFRHSRVQYREKTGRKDDMVMFTGLTNPELLTPWLEIIKRNRKSLVGILTQPLVSSRLLPLLDPEYKKHCVILVSQQVPSNLRQTVFYKGHIILSRLVPIASFYQGNYSADLLRDIESTQRYMFSQRILERNETIKVHILCNKRHYEELQKACEREQWFDAQLHEVNALLEKQKIKVPDELDFASTQFIWTALQKNYENHYARAEDRSYFYHRLGSQGLKLLASFMLSLGLGVSLYYGGQGYLFQSGTTELKSQQIRYQGKFNQLSQSKVDLPASTQELKATVEAAEIIERNYLRAPDETLIRISQDLSLFEDIRLNKLDWFIADNEHRTTVQEVQWLTKKKRSRRDRNKKPARKDFKGYYEIIILDGELLHFQGNYRYALSLLDDLEATLTESGFYYSVDVLERPIDTSNRATLAGDAGATESLKRQLEARFRIRLVREVPENV